MFALRNALEAARLDAGAQDEWFQISECLIFHAVD